MRAAVAAALLLGVAACASAPRAAGGDPAPAIQRVLDEQVAAWNRGDLEAFMDGYWRSPDLVFTSGGNVQRGWQTTLDRYRATYGSSPETMGRLAFSDLEVHPLADGAAWALGRWELDHEGDTMGGVFSLVLRSVAGRWVIVHDHTSRSGG
ncbi:MAG TPA: nuclear transport factor 2 family protein [Gemmatimonadota bacterium]|nr:nuclear transport factor 2 family protein [Gemmatimonadota bacterium]